MDFSKISRFVDQLAVDTENVLHLKSREIMKLLVKYKCPPGKFQRRCRGSDVLVNKGFKPAEALFILEWTECKKAWIYTNNSIDDQFVWVRKYLRKAYTWDMQNYDIYFRFCNFLRIYAISDRINEEYSSWRRTKTDWEYTDIARNVPSPSVVHVQSLQTITKMKCVSSGIRLAGAYKMFRGNHWWGEDDDSDWTDDE
jgi:hypothetical protein